MGIDSMRVGGGRCPPLIVGGLLIACFLLVCNWWSLSSENLDLLRQIDDLSEQLKISAEERDQCITQHGNLAQRFKKTEDDVNILRVDLEQEKDVAKRVEESQTLCKSELESIKKLDASKDAVIDTMRMEKETLNIQLDDNREENKRLQEELDNAQSELQKLKLTVDSLANGKPATNLSNTPSVANLAVEVSPSGLRGMLHHNTPIIVQDPPDARRQLPRFSVTMLEAATDPVIDNGTINGGDQESQFRADAAAAANGEVDDNVVPASNDDVEFNAVDGDRDQEMKKER